MVSSESTGNHVRTFSSTTFDDSSRLRHELSGKRRRDRQDGSHSNSHQSRHHIRHSQDHKPVQQYLPEDSNIYDNYPDFPDENNEKASAFTEQFSPKDYPGDPSLAPGILLGAVHEKLVRATKTTGSSSGGSGVHGSSDSTSTTGIGGTGGGQDHHFNQKHQSPSNPDYEDELGSGGSFVDDIGREAGGNTPAHPQVGVLREQQEKLLLQQLMRGYERDVRPVKNASHAVVVHVGITLTQIFDMVSQLLLLSSSKMRFG